MPVEATPSLRLVESEEASATLVFEEDTFIVEKDWREDSLLWQQPLMAAEIDLMLILSASFTVGRSQERMKSH